MWLRGSGEQLALRYLQVLLSLGRSLPLLLISSVTRPHGAEATRGSGWGRPLRAGQGWEAVNLDHGKAETSPNGSGSPGLAQGTELASGRL